MTVPYVKKCRKRNVQSADQKTHELFANDVPDIMNRLRTKLQMVVSWDEIFFRIFITWF